MDITKISLISDEDRERMKKNKSDIIMLKEMYEDLSREQEEMEKKKKKIKEEICKLVRERGENITDKTMRYEGNGYYLDVGSRQNIKFKDGLINYCRKSGLEDCIEKKESINKGRFLTKYNNGEINNDVFNNFVNVSYTDVLDIHNI